MKGAAAPGAAIALEIEQHVRAFQMVGKNIVPFTAILNTVRLACRELWMARRVPRLIGFQVFETEGHLVRIELLGTATELAPLELFDDALEALDLVVAGLDGVCHVTHQCMQEIDIGRQTIKLETHERF